MNVVDSSGWLAYFAGEANAGHFAAALENPRELVVPVITIYEVFKVVLREADESKGRQAVAVMQKGTVAELTPLLAMEAAKLSLNHCLPMADAMILATARAFAATLLTQDSHFNGLPGVRYFPKTVL